MRQFWCSSYKHAIADLIGKLGEDDGELNLGIVFLEVGLEGVEADVIPVDSLVIKLHDTG